MAQTAGVRVTFTGVPVGPAAPPLPSRLSQEDRLMDGKTTGVTVEELVNSAFLLREDEWKEFVRSEISRVSRPVLTELLVNGVQDGILSAPVDRPEHVEGALVRLTEIASQLMRTGLEYETFAH